MDVSTILGLLDEQSRTNAIEQCLSSLESTPRLDLDALRLCVILRSAKKQSFGNSNLDGSDAAAPSQNVQPSGPQDMSAQISDGYFFFQRLWEIISSRIANEPLDSDQFYSLAEIICTNVHFAYVLLNEKLQAELVGMLPGLSQETEENTKPGGETQESAQKNARKARAYLTLLKNSYWQPSEQNHVLRPGILMLLSSFVGMPALQEVALDAISALLSLLNRQQAIVVAWTRNESQSWLKTDSASEQLVLTASLVDDSFWDQLRLLHSKCFTTGGMSSKIFKTWLQWISQAATDQVSLHGLTEHSYWERVRAGLLYGHADQRKYCIGIIRRSLLVAHTDISTRAMSFRVAERARYLRAYEQFSGLFETIVLDRYANQVQACLPDLTKLFTSEITPLMATTLLSAALNPMVQEGVRKIIGNWYIDYVVDQRGDITGHVGFLIEGFLPWATIGDLFTSTLASTRDITICEHGASIASVLARYVSEIPDPPSLNLSGASDFSDMVMHSRRREVVLGVLDFILDAGGKIFQFSILYLLEGLIKGLEACIDEPALREPFTVADIDKICRISRLPGLPEIASDLYTEYCSQLCNLISPSGTHSEIPGYQALRQKAQRLMSFMEGMTKVGDEASSSDSLTLQSFGKQLDDSKHRYIQGENYAFACQNLQFVLENTDPASIGYQDLYIVMDALWEEADRRQFCRPVAVHISPLMFHPACMEVLIRQHSKKAEGALRNDLQAFLANVMSRLQQLSEGRIYILSNLAASIRQAVLQYPQVASLLPLEDYILRFVNSPPTIKSEFMFEVAAAEKLRQSHSHRDYYSYYGHREWHAYAALIDMLQRLPSLHMHVAKRTLDCLLEPWASQRTGIPIISKWKNVLQLQAMLLLAEQCIAEGDADTYLASFKHALILEPWPRYRFLLEWIIARIYYRFPGKSISILEDLTNLDENSSTHIASLMKLAVLMAPHETERFSTEFMTQLVSFAASAKVQIRHEANYAIPIVFDLAASRCWKSITKIPAFVKLNAFIRRLDKFQSAPWTIRTLKLDAVKDFTLVNIFQGEYLTIESPEKDRVKYEDLLALYEADRTSESNVPSGQVPLGTPITATPTEKQLPVRTAAQIPAVQPSQTSPAFFQTKSGFDIDSLHPPSGPPSAQTQRPSSVILVASLIDNPTNLGGLSRISESFGMQALYISDLKKTTHKDFKATSVTSEKHFPIHELKIPQVPHFLLDMKRQGYEVVGIEQTDQSGVLGTEHVSQRVGTLPKKCVLVLGSEKGGISAEVLAVIDRCVEIRTVGVTRSLNVQTAGGIALYEWWREWYGKA